MNSFLARLRYGFRNWRLARELVRLMGGTFGVSSFADAQVAFTVELPRHVAKYLDWFFVRILRIKSITGKRKEVPRAQLREFS